jgi:hypothetical protein
VTARISHRLADLLLLHPPLGEVPSQSEPPGHLSAGPDDTGGLGHLEGVVVRGDLLPALGQQVQHQPAAETLRGVDPALVLLVECRHKVAVVAVHGDESVEVAIATAPQPSEVVVEEIRRQFDDGEDVEGGAVEQGDGEEVGREDRLRLTAQELRPGRPPPARRGGGPGPPTTMR